MSDNSQILPLDVFIISWQGQHENATLIAKEILSTNNKITIVYSDPDPNFVFDLPCNLIKRSNELFWEDKFKACLDATGYDGMLVIHADSNCDDWTFLVKRCSDIINNNEDIGVWAPKIDGTYWNLSVSGITKIKDNNLVLSAMTDGIVFYLSNQIVSRMRQVKYGKNKFGWGIDGLFCAASYVNKKLVVIDTSLKIFHPQGIRGYDDHAAKSGMREFLNQFSLRERLKYHLLVTRIRFNYGKLALQRKLKLIKYNYKS